MECLIALCMATEATGTLPEAVVGGLVVLLAKQGGGWRPIGLLQRLPRWWSRVRLRDARAWEEAIPAEAAANFWGGKGRASAEAVWWQALHNEASRAQGLSVGCVLLDLWKAYEVVSLAMAQRRGLDMGYPEQLVQAAIRVYSGARHLVIDGVVSSECFYLSSGLIAGCSHAGRLLRCAMMVLDAEHRRRWKE
eukprot:132767-Pyramimonas_sp.AAC.1